MAAAFHGRAGIKVVVLFPKGLVSPTQERQLTCWGGNVRALAVRGTFDDCQRLVKQAFLDESLRARTALASANSINLGRLLPQSIYYAATSLDILRRYGERASFIVPSGNLGNALACLWARQLGLPIGKVILAHNANRAVPDFLASGEWRPRPSIATLASAMDVGNPSNMERLRALFPDLQELRGAVSACSVTDAEIRTRIRVGYEEYGQIWCPHTAIAAEAWERLPEEKRAGGRWVLVATAHPAKFPEIVEPLIGRAVPVPPSLAALFGVRVRVPSLMPTWRHCARCSRREADVEELSKLTPTAWALIGCAAALGFGLSWAWRWYRQYRARKALRAAVTGGCSDHLIDMLVPD